jgi:hypothetical protein
MHLCLQDRIRFDRIVKYHDKISFEHLVQNEHMSLRLIEYLRQNGFEDRLTGDVMSYSRHITLPFIKKHQFLDWNYAQVGYHMLLKNYISPTQLDTILHNKHIPTIHHFINYAKNLNLDHVINHSSIEWSWSMLSGGLPFEVIQEHPDLHWDSRGMSANPTLDLDYVLASPDKEWLYPNICRYNQNVNTILRDASMWQKLDGFDQDFDFWWYVSFNKHITIEIIKKYADTYKYNLDWGYVSRIIPLNDMLANPDLPWDYTSLSYNPTLQLEFVLKNRDVVWDWPKVSQHATFDFERFNTEYITKWHWDWKMLCMNKSFLHVSQNELEQKAMKVIASNKIKRQFKESISNPTYLLCQQRLLREFASVIG